MSNDIHDIWMEGHRLSQGIDLYLRTLQGDMRHNDNYPTYLPLSYLFSATLHLFGIRTFEAFLAVWRPLTLLCHLCIGILIYRDFSIRGYRLLGFCATSLVLIGRWSVYLVESLQLEFVTILPLLVAVLLLREYPRRAGMILGVSLAIKQIGLLLLPLMVFQLARSRSRLEVRQFVVAAAVVPFVASLPFLIWGVSGFLHSILFSLTRISVGHPETGRAPRQPPRPRWNSSLHARDDLVDLPPGKSWILLVSKSDSPGLHPTQSSRLYSVLFLAVDCCAIGLGGELTETSFGSRARTRSVPAIDSGQLIRPTCLAR